MRIMIIDPGFSYSTLAVAESYYRAFEKLGYEIIEYDTLRGLSIIKSGLESHKTNNLNELTEWVCAPILNQVMADRIDYLFVIHGWLMNPMILVNIRNVGCKVVLVLTDDPMQCDVSKEWARFYDYVFTNEKNTVELYGKNCFYLPMAVDETIFFPRWFNEKYDSDIFYGGSFYKERLKFVKSNSTLRSCLLKYKTTFAGAYKEDFGDDWELNSLFKANKISYEEMAKFTSGAKVCIDLPRDEFRGSLFGKTNKNKIPASCLSPRIFECAATRTMPITTNQRKEIKVLFPEGLIPTFNSSDELVEILEDLLENWYKQDERLTELQNHCLKNHTYCERVKTIEKLIGLLPSKTPSRRVDFLNQHVINAWEKDWRNNFDLCKSHDFYTEGIDKVKDKYDGVLNIVSNGPSLYSVLSDIDFSHKTLCVNKAMKLLEDFRCEFVTIIHPNKELYERCFKDFLPRGILLASTVSDFNVIKKWKDANKEVLFFNTGKEKPVKDEVTSYTKFPILGSSYAVGYTALLLGKYMGFKEIRIYGLDFCFLNNESYAREKLSFEKTKKRDLRIVGDRSRSAVITDTVMLKVRDSCLNLIRKNSDIIFRVYGGGILYCDGIENLKGE